MSSLNKVSLLGRLGQAPETRYTKDNTAVSTLSIATSEKYKDKSGQQQENTEWHRCVAWGKLAEICDKYLGKGDQVYVEGKIQTRQWEDKNGQKRYTTEIKLKEMVMLGSSPQAMQTKGQPNTKPDDFAAPADDFDEAELPF